jgi:hypothetical protein
VPDPSTDETIARTARDQNDADASRAVLRALTDRRAELAGGGLPPEDPHLTDRILVQARSRSAEIRRSRSGLPHSARQPVSGSPVAWWLIAAWLGVLAAAVVAWRWAG